MVAKASPLKVRACCLKTTATEPYNYMEFNNSICSSPSDFHECTLAAPLIFQSLGSKKHDRKGRTLAASLHSFGSTWCRAKYYNSFVTLSTGKVEISLRTYATGTVLALALQMAGERRKQGDRASRFLDLTSSSAIALLPPERLPIK